MTEPQFVRGYGGPVRRCYQSAYGVWESVARSIVISQAKREGVIPSGSILGLFVSAGQEQYPHALDEFRRLWRPFRENGHSCVLVDNLGISPDVLLDGEHFVRGTNRDWEFSAWQEGFDYWKANAPRGCPEWVVCITSAFTRRNPRRRAERILNPVTLARSPEGIVGWGNVHNAGAWGVLGYDCRRFIRTDAFAISGRVLQSQGFVTVTDALLENLIPRIWDGQRLIHSEANVDSDFREWLADWLERGWYGSASFSSRSYPLLRKKAQAIFNERLLTARCIEQGFSAMCGNDINRFTGLSVLKPLGTLS